MSLNADKHPPRSFFSFPKTAIIFLVIAALALAGVWLATSRQSTAQALHRKARLLMDTEVQIVFQADSTAEEVSDQVFDEMERLESRFSRSLRESELSTINARAGEGPVKVSPATLDLIEQALHYSDLSGGAFDPTIAPLLDRWGFLEENYRVPPDSEIEVFLPLVDYTMVKVDRHRQEVSLLKEGMRLDLGGVAKGYIIDRGVDRLQQAGVSHGFIDAGGDIRIAGSKPGGEPWRIGIRHPREEEKILAVVPLSEGAIVTSGDYERMFEQKGQRYHHILDPHTGYPAGQLISVTVIAPTATEADALSTAVFVLGPEQGLKLIESLPGIEAVLVTPRMEVIISSGLQGKVELPGD